MSLDKAILHGKEHRKPYSGGKAIDKTCRNHGGCEWCLGNRMHSTNVKKEKADSLEKEFSVGYSPEGTIKINPPDQDSAVWPDSPEPLTGMECERVQCSYRSHTIKDDVDEFLARIQRGEDTRLSDVGDNHFSYE